MLDACAVIAYIEGEAGADRVEEILQSGHPVYLAAVNLLEVCYDVQRTRGSRDAVCEVISTVKGLGIRIEWRMYESWILAASNLKAQRRVSLADAVARGLAQHLNAHLVTADHHEFDSVEQAGLGLFDWIR